MVGKPALLSSNLLYMRKSWIVVGKKLLEIWNPFWLLMIIRPFHKGIFMALENEVLVANGLPMIKILII
jgi:hypothetical protein